MKKETAQTLSKFLKVTVACVIAFELQAIGIGLVTSYFVGWILVGLSGIEGKE